MTETINTSFDPETLPAWARQSTAIRWLAARNLEFRCDVCQATTGIYRRLLARQAQFAYDMNYGR